MQRRAALVLARVHVGPALHEPAERRVAALLRRHVDGAEAVVRLAVDVGAEVDERRQRVAVVVARRRVHRRPPRVVDERHVGPERREPPHARRVTRLSRHEDGRLAVRRLRVHVAAGGHQRRRHVVARRAGGGVVQRGPAAGVGQLQLRSGREQGVSQRQVPRLAGGVQGRYPLVAVAQVHVAAARQQRVHDGRLAVLRADQQRRVAVVGRQVGVGGVEQAPHHVRVPVLRRVVHGRPAERVRAPRVGPAGQQGVDGVRVSVVGGDVQRGVSVRRRRRHVGRRAVLQQGPHDIHVVVLRRVVQRPPAGRLPDRQVDVSGGR